MNGFKSINQLQHCRSFIMEGHKEFKKAHDSDLLWMITIREKNGQWAVSNEQIAMRFACP